MTVILMCSQYSTIFNQAGEIASTFTHFVQPNESRHTRKQENHTGSLWKYNSLKSKCGNRELFSKNSGAQFRRTFFDLCASGNLVLMCTLSYKNLRRNCAPLQTSNLSLLDFNQLITVAECGSVIRLTDQGFGHHRSWVSRSRAWGFCFRA
jgi:hypothetical protein